MHHYRLGVTIWRAIAVWAAYAGFGWFSVFAAVDWPDEPLMSVEAWVIFAAAALPGGWRALENYRKNAGEDGRPLWNWPWSKFTAPALLCLLAVGCTSACAVNQHTMSHPDGSVASSRQITTLGAKLPEGSGESRLSIAADGASDMATGSRAVGMSADNPTDLLLGMFAAILNGYQSALAAPRPEPTPGIGERLLEPATIDALADALRPRLGTP